MQRSHRDMSNRARAAVTAYPCAHRRGAVVTATQRIKCIRAAYAALAFMTFLIFTGVETTAIAEKLDNLPTGHPGVL